MFFDLNFTPVNMPNISELAERSLRFRRIIEGYCESKGYRAIFVGSGREALFLSGLIGLIRYKNSEAESPNALIQPFTCGVVPQALLSAGYNIVYGDIGSTFCLDPVSWTKILLSSPIALLLVQHTFGHVAGVDERIYNDERKYLLVEDCAHIFDLRLLDRGADALIFSFDRSKPLNCFSGGLLVLRESIFDSVCDDQLEVSGSFDRKSAARVIGCYFENFVRSIRNEDVYKLFLSLGFKSGLFVRSKFKHQPERASYFDFRLLGFGLDQLLFIDKTNDLRAEIVARMSEKFGVSGFSGPLLRFPVKDSIELREKLSKVSVRGGVWFPTLFEGVQNWENVGYQVGRCPIAESLAPELINLPVNPDFLRCV